MILEGILTTKNLDGTVNIAPMGPVVDELVQSFLLRPYRSTTTFDNLVRTRCGVFHITDDVELIARAAIGRLDGIPPMHAAAIVDGSVLSDACRWIELEATSIDDSQPRSQMDCQVVHRESIREFVGFVRAKHAVLEAAILATRLQWLPHTSIADELQRLARIVDKTAGSAERRAFDLLRQYVALRLTLPNDATPTVLSQPH
jgi:hypothetical protein